MLSPLRKLPGHEDKFHDLLEASAEEALASTKLLASYLQRSEAYTSTADLDDFIHSRRKDKKITRQISEELAKTFVTPLEREDKCGETQRGKAHPLGLGAHVAGHKPARLRVVLAVRVKAAGILA